MDGSEERFTDQQIAKLADLQVAPDRAFYLMEQGGMDLATVRDNDLLVAFIGLLERVSNLERESDSRRGF